MDFKKNIEIINNNFTMLRLIVPVWILAIIAFFIYPPLTTIILGGAFLYFRRRFNVNNTNFIFEKSPQQAQEIFRLKTQMETQKEIFTLFRWQVLLSLSHTVLIVIIFIFAYLMQKNFWSHIFAENTENRGFDPTFTSNLMHIAQTLTYALVYYTFLCGILSIIWFFYFSFRQYLNRRKFKALTTEKAF